MNKNTNSDELKRRIRRGRAWLSVHFEDSRFPSRLKHYETLVDEARILGLDEQECWEFEPDASVEDLTEEEILFTTEEGYGKKTVSKQSGIFELTNEPIDDSI